MKKSLSLVLCFAFLFSFAAVALADSEQFVLDESGMIYDVGSLNAQAAEIASETGLVVSCRIGNSRDNMNEYEQAQSIFEENFGSAKGFLLLDLLDRKQLYLFVTPSLSGVSDPDYNHLLSEYDAQVDYDSAVRAYLDAAETLARRLSGTSVNSERKPGRVIDEALIFDAQTLRNLNTLADSISEQYRCDVDVVFLKTTDSKSAQAYADDYFDYNNCGYGPDHDGILLLVAVQDRTFAVSTFGYATYAFTDYGQQVLDEQYLGYFKNNNWAEGARAFIEGCGSLLYSARNGQAVDVPGASRPSAKEGLLKLIPIDILAAFLLAFIPISSMKKKNKNVEEKDDAFDYVRPDSFALSYKNDRFMHSHISKIKKPDPPQNHSHGGGGGSTMHMSSSGRSHGGHSGSF